ETRQDQSAASGSPKGRLEGIDLDNPVHDENIRILTQGVPHHHRERTPRKGIGLRLRESLHLAMDGFLYRDDLSARGGERRGQAIERRGATAGSDPRKNE